jgi:hypothetical protein
MMIRGCDLILFQVYPLARRRRQRGLNQIDKAVDYLCIHPAAGVIAR